MTKARDIASASPAPSTVSATEIGYLDGVTSAIQTQIDSKIGSASAISPTLIDAKGDLIVGSAADTAARLAVGTNNYVLTADSSATNGVKWAAPAGGGKVLQVVYATTTTQTTVASATYTDTTLSATITPISASSTILVFVNQGGYSGDTNGDAGGKIQLLRGVTVVYEPDLSNGLNSNYVAVTPGTGSISETNLGLTMNLVYRDSPATTSSTTYKTQGRRYGASGNIIFQQSSSYSSMLLMEIGA